MCRPGGCIPRSGTVGQVSCMFSALLCPHFQWLHESRCNLTVPNWWTFRWFQFVFPINEATMDIFVQLSLCAAAVGLWGIPRHLKAEQQEALRTELTQRGQGSPRACGLDGDPRLPIRSSGSQRPLHLCWSSVIWGPQRQPGPPERLKGMPSWAPPRPC